NDCDGQINENVGNWGQECKTPITDGECRGTGSYVCATNTTTTCDAVKVPCTDCTDYCDGLDNDCDGDVDEPFSAPGTVANFVQPAVVQISDSPNLWMYTYEASRPDAGLTTAGSGNGYHCTGGGECALWVPPGRTYGVPDPPAAVTIDATPACSVPDRLPWFNASPTEAEHVCFAAGGHLCDMDDWKVACQATEPCNWGFSPRGAACTSGWSAGTRDCNIWSHDFDTGTAGQQHGLYTTAASSASGPLYNCWADLTSLWGNPATVGDPLASLFDMSGNLREITFYSEGATTSDDNSYALMGGSFFSPEDGATCTFDFYKVNVDYKLFDTGFRCCFDTDPT
ncbi:MAG: hypothetical protein JRI23_29895, partial [Deltaproteobacteria bacterium]|nr:hypothetical protein [Deltaproteobacteria bacterium]MBW2536363.1 hypothetical protein [Deltaproteobacteria bacterium]